MSFHRVFPYCWNGCIPPGCLHVHQGHPGSPRSRGLHTVYLQPIITQYFIDNKSEIWLLFLIAHSKR